MLHNFFSQHSNINNRQLFSKNPFLRQRFSTVRGSNPFTAYTSTRTTILSFIGLNAAVFSAWQYGILQRDRPLLTWLSQNFTLSPSGYREGRYWTLLTSAISHQGLAHFAFNMMTLYAFGSIMGVAGVGGAYTAALCVGGAVAGSSAWLWQQSSTASGGRNSRRSALGASGVVMSTGAVATCLMPFAPMQLMFIPINIPLWVLTLAYMGFDTYYLNSSSMVGHAAHLGGSVFGVAFYALYLRRLGGVARMFGIRR